MRVRGPISGSVTLVSAGKETLYKLKEVTSLVAENYGNL